MKLLIEPLLPFTWVAGLAVVAAILLLPGLLRRMRGAWLRALAVAAVVAALLNPVLVNEEREPLPTVVGLVVDRSASQGIEDRTEEADAILDALTSRLAALDDIEVRVIEAGAAEGDRTGDGTRLFEPLAAGLGDVPPDRLGAVVMITDGQVHDVPDASTMPDGVPLHALLTGRPGERDRRVVIDAAPRFGIVNETQEIQFRVLDEGGETGGRVEVIVTLDGEPHAVTVVREGAQVSIDVEIAHGGPNIIELRAAPLDGELTEVNNRALVQIEGVRENLRVLLVSGEPHSGERTWRNLLKSDAAVDLVHFTILRPPSKQDGTPINQLSLIAFPTRELFSEKIDEFDLIIFDRYHHRGVLPLLYFDNISRYVRDGGALLVAAGPEFAGFTSLSQTPLAPVLPVAPTGDVLEIPFHPTVTDAGFRHPVTRALEGAETDPPDWGRFFRLVDVVDPTGDVLMRGAEERPLLVLAREGEGRVGVLLSDHAWLWARGLEGGGPHVDLLRRVAHWLMQEPDLEEEALRLRVVGSDLVAERQTMGDSVEPITIVRPSGTIDSLEPALSEDGVWRATTPADEIGLYRAEQGDRRAIIHIGPTNPKEFIDARATDHVLAPIATETGGGTVWAIDGSGAVDLPRIVPLRTDASASGRDWIGIRLTDASILKGINRTPVLAGLGGIFGVAGLLGLLVLIGLPFATWLREGR